MRRSIGYAVFRRPLGAYRRKLSGAIAVSEPAKAFASRYFGGEYRIIPNGVDLRRFSPRVAPHEALRDGTFNILYVGRLDPRKGLPVLFRAFAELAAAYGDGVRLVVVGDGPLRRKLRAMVPSAARDRVWMTGPVARDLLPRFYAGSHVVCSPALGGESFGIVLLEAMASGVPVVASAIPGYRAVLSNGLHGLLTEPGSARSLLSALELLLRDEGLRREMGEAARLHASKYSWDAVAEATEQFFFEILDASRPSRAHPRPQPVSVSR